VLLKSELPQTFSFPRATSRPPWTTLRSPAHRLCETDPESLHDTLRGVHELVSWCTIPYWCVQLTLRAQYLLVCTTRRRVDWRSKITCHTPYDISTVSVSHTGTQSAEFYDNSVLSLEIKLNTCFKQKKIFPSHNSVFTVADVANHFFVL
jgi:hypothetical protein